MKTVKTRGHNVWFNAPEGWDESRGDVPCGSLSVRREACGPRVSHVSTWEPTVPEIHLLLGGGVIELSCVGIQPPVALRVVPAAEDKHGEGE